MVPTDKSKGKATKHPGVTKLAEGRYLVLKTWTDPGTGRKIFRQKIVEGDLDAATAARSALRSQGPSAKPQSRPRLGAFADSWLEKHRAKLTSSAADRYTVDVANINVEFRDWWVDAITYEALEEWQRRVGTDYAAPTVNSWHRTLRLILDVAVRRRLLATNPARELSTLPEGRTKGARGTSLSAAELRSFVAAIPVLVARGKLEERELDAEGEKKPILDEPTARLLHLLAWTGMRLGEILALRWVDVVDGELRVERSVWRGEGKVDKTDDPRRITIVDVLTPMLEEQRRELISTQHPGLASGLVFPSSPRHAAAGRTRRKSEAPSWYRSQSAIQEAVRAVCAEAKTPRITPHSLRRTFEDLLREAGVEQLVRRAVAGWRSERAQGIYATVRREARDAAATAMVRLVLG